MDLTSEHVDRTQIVRVNGPRIDAAGSIGFKDAMQRTVMSDCDRVVLDLAKVQFIDSSGLGAIVAVMKMLLPSRRLELAAPTPTVERVLQLTRLNTMLTVHPEVPRSGTDQTG